MCPSVTRMLCVVLLFFSMATTQVSTGRAQSLPAPTPTVQVAPSSVGATGVQAPAISGLVVQPGVGIGGQLGQGAIPGGSQYGQATGPVRLPNQNCGGMGQCAWAGQSQATASCTADARRCITSSSGPSYSTISCSNDGGRNICTSTETTGTMTSQDGLPVTGIGTGLPSVGTSSAQTAVGSTNITTAGTTGAPATPSPLPTGVAAGR
jgi:hypothetical protein